jgi:ssDNA-binding Zn-finger/Zn-ribbon topoisomerase 1
MPAYDPDEVDDERQRDKKPPRWVKDLRKIIVKTVPCVLGGVLLAVILTGLGLKNREAEPKKAEAAPTPQAPAATTNEPAPATLELISAPAADAKPQASNGATTYTRPVCPVCGSPMVRRNGPFGEFFGCSKYPECRGTRPMEPEQKEAEEREAAKEVTVEFLIQGAYKPESGKFLLLNSMKEYKDPACQTVAIDLEKCPIYQHAILKKCIGLTVQATGRKSDYNGRPQLVVTNPRAVRIWRKGNPQQRSRAGD